MKALIPISILASDVCSMEIGDSTEKYHLSIMKWMSAGFKEMHLFMSPFISVKTEVFKPGNSIEMPCDFVYETKVGMKIGDRIALLWRDYGYLSPNNRPVGQVESMKYINSIIHGSVIPDALVPFYNYYGTNVLDAYGVGVDPAGFYTLDQTNGVIHIGSLWPDDAEVVIEYKSDGVSQGLELVPSEWSTALTNYALWKYYLKKRDSRYAEYKQEYLTQYYMIKDLYNFRPLDYLARIFQNTPRQTINNLM